MYSYDIKYRKGPAIEHLDLLLCLPMVTESTRVCVANVSAGDDFEDQMLSYQVFASSTAEDSALAQVKEFFKERMAYVEFVGARFTSIS